ncbi:MAG: SPFH domain-containing protein, partial [Planctomycetota bacterium]|nr:SPFH domain-containing protein [Planctomycetota bacterium]
YSNIAAMVKQATTEDFGQYGIQLVDLLVESITPPPEVQEMINRATGVAAQDVEKYKAIATADAVRDAARNPGSAGEGMGLGAGLGMGIAMARTVSDQLSAPASPPAAAAPAPADIHAKLTELKKLFDDGLITASEYADGKKDILSRL